MISRPEQPARQEKFIIYILGAYVVTLYLHNLVTRGTLVLPYIVLRGTSRIPWRNPNILTHQDQIATSE